METAIHTMNPDTAISRAEAAPVETASERRADVVSRSQFRLLLWMGAVKTRLDTIILPPV